ncbi:MAG: hypothetical protein IPK97_15445 [Ahniella sp.]|nr:hypothetical protein [Ahniella sp.]
MTEANTPSTVLTIGEFGLAAVQSLVDQLGLRLHHVADGEPIPGSYWGDSEAGIIGTNLYGRADTPMHSLLHEACHVLVADPARRESIHTDASDSIAEEDATCYLQLLIASRVAGFGFDRACADMDAWGYTFRLGSAKAWFEQDAEEARAFIAARPDLSVWL